MERVAVLHPSSGARAALKTQLEARGLAVALADGVEGLAEAASRGPLALVLADAATLASVGADAIRTVAAGDRMAARVPVVGIVSGAVALEALGSVDEVVREPVDAAELGLRVQSGLVRGRTADLVAAASHELRSPLHAIVTFLDLLGRTGLPDPQRSMVEGATTASRHLLDLVEDLLEHARLGQGTVELDASEISLRAVLRDAVSIATDAAGPPVAVAIEIAPEVPDAYVGDGTRVRQLVINLVSNALKFAVREPVRVRARAGAGAVHVEVVDDGPGVPDGAREVVFEPFRQVDPAVGRRTGGTGLGLAIARALARRMGGDVTVQGGPDGKGAVFEATLALPTVADAARPAAPNGLALLADSDALHRAMTVALLERLGYRVDTVGEGVAALLHVIEHRPQLVVLELELPVLDGLEVARRAREAGIDAAFIAFSRTLDDAARSRGAAAGLPVVAKPIAPLLFQRALRQVTAPNRGGGSDSPVQVEDPSGARSRLDVSRSMEDALRAMIAAVETHARSLEAAIGTRDLGLAADVTRTLRGAVIALDARGLEAVLRDVEQAARANDLEECRRAHRSWQEALGSLRQNVDRFLVRATRTR